MTDILAFGSYSPDQSGYKGDTSSFLQNVIPIASGYGPFPDFSAYTSKLAAGNDSFTKVLLHFDGTDAATTFTDSNAGGSSHTWTADDDAQIDTAQSKFGGASGLFDGTDDFITTPDHADFTLGSSDFTVDFWFRCDAAGGTDAALCGQRNLAGTIASLSFEIYRTDTNVIKADVGQGTSLVSVTGTTQFTDAVNTGWHHVAFVRTGNTLKLFIDGAQEGGDVSITGAVNDSNQVLGVGIIGAFTSVAQWEGWIDEFRLSVGVARWTAAFTPPGAPYDAESNGACRGMFFARNSDGTVTIFAATATKLLKLNNTDFSWIDVSKTGDYVSVSTNDQWQFAQFNKFVFAVQANTAPQVFDLTVSTAFADLAGSPPQARYIAIVGRFVVLSGLSSTPFRVQWSGLDATTTWTPGTSSSDFQDLPDGGIVRGVAGGEYGTIMQDGSIRRMIFVGGDLVFQIERISESKGIFAPLSLTRAGDRVFYIGLDGFKSITLGGIQSIGKERIDKTFFADVDAGNLKYCLGAADPQSSRVIFVWKSSSNSSSSFNTGLIYDYELDRWSPLTLMGEYIANLARPGITLENLDAISTSIDALTVPFDDISTAATTALAGCNTSHQLGFYSGSNLEAILDTSEQPADDFRMRVRGFRPVTDAATCYGSIGQRETLQEAISYSAEQPVNGRGRCPANVSTRLATGRLRIPAGTSWTFATGVEPEIAPEGRR